MIVAVRHRDIGLGQVDVVIVGRDVVDRHRHHFTMHFLHAKELYGIPGLIVANSESPDRILSEATVIHDVTFTRRMAEHAQEHTSLQEQITGGRRERAAVAVRVLSAVRHDAA